MPAFHSTQSTRRHLNRPRSLLTTSTMLSKKRMGAGMVDERRLEISKVVAAAQVEAQAVLRAIEATETVTATDAILLEAAALPLPSSSGRSWVAVLSSLVATACTTTAFKR